MEEVKKYIKSLLIENKTIVIGCSGGPDSMSLLMLLCEQREPGNIIVCAHINHNLRVESVAELEFVKEICQTNNIVFESMTIDEYGNDNFHNEARTIRYNYFESLIKKYDATILMTAHHGDDLIETILMRIVRGSVLKGYSGFSKEVTKNGYKIIRPLITVTKEDIQQYNESNNIKYVNDQSNESNKYTRNRYRHYILPFLKSEDANVHRKFLQFNEEISESANFINRFVNQKIEEVMTNDKLDIKQFKELDNIIQTKILEELISDLYPDDLFVVSHIHVEVVKDLIYNDKANAKVYLPGNVIANKSYNHLELIKNEKVETYEYILTDSITLPNKHILKIIEESNEKSNYIIRLDSSKLSLPLIVRTRYEGDSIKVKNLSGSKKIKDIFIDEKISLSQRNSWPILTDSKGEILWIPGIKKSQFDREINENYDIIIKYEN